MNPIAYKPINTYPLTRDGWEQAFQELAGLDPTVIPELRKELVKRTEDDARLSNEPAEEPAVPQVPARSSPEVRARILQMFKRGNRKYAMPFENDRLAVLSLMGGNWEEYGQVVLQMAITGLPQSHAGQLKTKAHAASMAEATY